MIAMSPAPPGPMLRFEKMSSIGTRTKIAVRSSDARSRNTSQRISRHAMSHHFIESPARLGEDGHVRVLERALFGRDSYHADVGVEQGAQRARVDVRRIIRLEAHGREAVLRREYRRAESERRESCQRSVGTAREGHAKARASTSPQLLRPSDASDSAAAQHD